MWGMLILYEKRIWDEHDERIEVLPWTTNKIKAIYLRDLSKDLDLNMERLKALQWSQQSILTKMKKVKKLMSKHIEV